MTGNPKCPHCGKTGCIPHVAELSVENYGDAIFHVRCVHCKGMIKVALSRVVVADYPPEKSDHAVSDWGD